MRALLTGSQTEAGQALSPALLRQGFTVRCLSGDLFDRVSVRRQMGYVDEVVHADFIDGMASLPFRSLVEHNLQGSIIVAAAAEDMGLPFYFCLPTAAYGKHKRSLDMTKDILIHEYCGVEITDPRDGIP